MRSADQARLSVRSIKRYATVATGSRCFFAKVFSFVSSVSGLIDLAMTSEGRDLVELHVWRVKVEEWPRLVAWVTVSPSSVETDQDLVAIRFDAALGTPADDELVELQLSHYFSALERTVSAPRQTIMAIGQFLAGFVQKENEAAA